MQNIGYCSKEIQFGFEPSYLRELISEFPTNSATTLGEWIRSPEFEWPDKETMSEIIWDFMDRRMGTREEVQLQDNKRRESMKMRYDAGVKKVRFNPDELVMLWDISKKGIGAKLSPRWRGPFVVESLAGDHDISYKIRQINGKAIKGSFHGNHLRQFKRSVISCLSKPTGLEKTATRC